MTTIKLKNDIVKYILLSITELDIDKLKYLKSEYEKHSILISDHFDNYVHTYDICIRYEFNEKLLQHYIKNVDDFEYYTKDENSLKELLSLYETLIYHENEKYFYDIVVFELKRKTKGVK